MIMTYRRRICSHARIFFFFLKKIEFSDIIRSPYYDALLM